jgi:hypothetical protein
VNEGITADDAARTQAQVDVLVTALDKAAGILEKAE